MTTRRVVYEIDGRFFLRNCPGEIAGTLVEKARSRPASSMAGCLRRPTRGGGATAAAQWRSSSGVYD